MELVVAFARDLRVRTIMALIVLDVVLGVAASIRTGQFNWAQVGRFYTSMVLPNVLGFAAVWFVTPYLVGDLLGEFSDVLGQALVVLAWAALMGQLANSILTHVKELWGGVPG